MKRLAVFMFWAAIGTATAQPVIITGTIVGPGGDLLNGSCDYVPSATFTASDGRTVSANVTTRVQFSRGALRVSLEPTTNGVPSTAVYRTNCTAPSQSVIGTDGRTHQSSGSWGPWYFVVAPSSTTLEDVIRYQPPSNTLVTYTATVSGTSTTILARTHHLGTSPWIVGCQDSSGNLFEVTATITGAGDVTISGASMSGTCTLAGAGADWVATVAMAGRSVVVLATVHNLINPRLGRCYDSTGQDYEPGSFTASPANGTVTLIAATSAPVFTGSCVLQ